MRNKMLLAMMALAAIEPLDYDPYGSKRRGRKYVPEKDPEKPIPKGHKEFNINGQIVYALNYKNALKKVKKLNS
jgi:hypothetical protein